MIIAVLTGLGTLFYVGFWLITAAYVGWASTGSRRFAWVIGSAGFLCVLAGVLLSLRVIAALLGWI